MQMSHYRIIIPVACICLFSLAACKWVKHSATRTGGSSSIYPSHLPSVLADLYPELRQSIADARQRCVTVETKSNKGSGFLVGPDLVLTNFHILEASSTIWVNNERSIVSKASPEDDMVLLKTMTAHELRLLVFDEYPSPSQITFYAGSPLNSPCAIFFGTVLVTDADEIVTDTPALDGMSGSALYALNGKLVGMQTWARKKKKEKDGYLIEYVSLAIPTKKIKQFLEETVPAGQQKKP